MVRARQAVVTEPFKTGVREVEIPDPGPNQILLAAEYSAISAGTELAVYTGTHQWLKDPNLPEWKFPFRPGYSAAGRVLKVGKDFPGGFKEGDRVSFPGNHASAELLTVGQERCRVWKMPDGLAMEKAALACIARYGLGAPIRAGLTLGRSATHAEAFIRDPSGSCTSTVGEPRSKRRSSSPDRAAIIRISSMSLASLAATGHAPR